MKFFDDINELKTFLAMVFDRSQIGLQLSLRFPGFIFWNATGSENAAEFPTFYWPVVLQHKLVEQISPVEDLRIRHFLRL